MAQTLRDVKDNAARYFVSGQFAEALAEYQGVLRAIPDEHKHPEGQRSASPALRECAVFGELSMMLGLSATATVRTKTPCTRLWLDRAACERHLLAQSGMREAFSALIAERLGRTARLFSAHSAQEQHLHA